MRGVGVRILFTVRRGAARGAIAPQNCPNYIQLRILYMSGLIYVSSLTVLSTPQWKVP